MHTLEIVSLRWGRSFNFWGEGDGRFRYKLGKKGTINSTKEYEQNQKYRILFD